MLTRITTATVTRVPRVAARFYSEGSTGSYRGEGSGDSFTVSMREEKHEDLDKEE
jgi:hypothetical protein